MRIIIAGSRSLREYGIVVRAMSDLVKEMHLSRDELDKIEIVSGACPTGADALGERFALRNNLSLKKFPADWGKYGKAGGPIRNRQMAEYAAADHGILMAFWDGKSRGTASMIREANAHWLTVRIIKIT